MPSSYSIQMRVTKAIGLMSRLTKILQTAGNRVYAKFSAKLRKFLADKFSEDIGATVMIRRHQCLYLMYQSMKHWTERRNALRCNPQFHDQSRHDFALVNNTAPVKNLTCAHLQILQWNNTQRRFGDHAGIQLVET
ncbi:hypothetical protein DFH09DRAFT_1462594 [Mycena vulgaris]|nr:hypothetical protein DFH09DRAFT_1462594 [Mycena vulgaris]